MVAPVDVEAAAVTTVYDGQSPVEEKELLRFLDVLPQFRSWARENRIEAHPVARRGKADFLYPEDAARWVEAKGWDARRFFCVMGRMAAALVIVEDGNDLQARPKDMPVVDKSEVELSREGWALFSCRLALFRLHPPCWQADVGHALLARRGLQSLSGGDGRKR